MFEDKQTSASTKAMADEQQNILPTEEEKKEESTFAKDSSSAEATGDKPGDQGPEDIFSQTVSDVPNEPSLKAAPSSFVKKNGEQTAMPGQMPVMPDVLPTMPKTGLNKKNLIIFIAIIAVVMGLVAAVIWWFISKKNNADSTINPAVLDLFTNTNTNQTSSKPAEQATKTAPVRQPQQIADVDGDGLSDQEEASLGTSINSPDTDNDGLYDREEVKVYQTDPLKSDTDNDGWKDGEEVRKNQDPLSPDPAPLPENYFQSKEYHFGFIYPQEMVLESSQGNIVQFNDNINQIKLYIYINGSQPSLPASDVSYIVGQEGNKLIIKDSLENPEDATPYATQFTSQYYTSENGLSYFIYYLATKRADNHKEKFENILKTFEFN